MKILTISPLPLYPWKTGLQHRIYNLFKPIHDSHQITVLSFALDTPPTDSEQKHIDELFEEVVYIPNEEIAPDPVSRFRRIISWFSPKEVNIGPAGRSHAMQVKLYEMLDSGNYDLLFVASPFVLNYALNIYQVPVVFDAIDDTSLLFKREIKRKRGIIGKLNGVKDWLVIRQMEKKFYGRFKQIVLTSATDAKTMKSLCPNSDITVIPNGVDALEFEQKYDLTENPSLVFTGVMNYRPNEEAMLYFCREILPTIQLIHPDIELTIVGRDPTPAIKGLEKQYKKVTVTGTVDDINPYIGRSWVYVCPLISGAGIKNKVLEAWAARTPLVATGLSCEGIEVSPNEDVLVGNTPSEFADQVMKLIEDRLLAKRLSDAGRKKVLERYDWESKAKALEAIVEKGLADFKA